ncbi:MAG: alpha/beta fold hydrolase [Pantoea sp.]|uniref:alpha/beta fold hydrolase n=1 Tax=Pantoea sp. TaxID=69393 RepID=UPI0029085E5D|nr:alpha/beta fold hydrolase [Pantoea sp.]MDU7840297.1 alpha/beta fold hydrolase [Pantoea sp.]
MIHGSMPTAPEGFSHKFATVNGLRFHYVEGGAPGEPIVVLMAGFPESWYAWRHVMPQLGRRFHIIALDLPGQGDSDRPPDGYDTQTVARRTHDLLNHLGVRRYSLAAHDVGAWVAFPYAHLFAQEVEALALMDAGIPGVTLPDRLPAASPDAWKTWHFAFHAVPDLPEILLEGRERAYLEWFFWTKTASPACYGEEEIAEYLRIYGAPGGMRAGLAFYRSAALSAEQNRALAQKGELTMPVLGLSADQGSIPDMSALLRSFAADVAGETITECGHFLAEEKPDAVADALMRFFSRCAGSASMPVQEGAGTHV